MKKLVLALLVLAMVLSMTACSSKEPTLTSVLDYPISSDSLSECKKFLKDCGYEVESAANNVISFKGSVWNGYASLDFPAAVTLDYNSFQSDVSFEDALESAQAELKAACGEPYATDTNKMLGMTMEFYSYNDKLVHVSIISSGMNSLSITVMAAPAK